MPNVQWFVDHNQQLYDGTQLRSLWAFRRYNLQGDSIVSFRGPCRVELDNLVDIQDAMNGAFIYSPDMMHFIVEHFDCDLEKAVYRQRLLVSLARDVLADTVDRAIVRVGDDLFVEKRKLSVSIATVSPVSTLIHTGLNINAEGAPVPAIGLTELGFADGDAAFDLAHRISREYANEVQDIFMARCKVRGVP